jgi:hypothetical protein
VAPKISAAERAWSPARCEIRTGEILVESSSEKKKAPPFRPSVAAPVEPAIDLCPSISFDSRRAPVVNFGWKQMVPADTPSIPAAATNSSSSRPLCTRTALRSIYNKRMSGLACPEWYCSKSCPERFYTRRGESTIPFPDFRPTRDSRSESGSQVATVRARHGHTYKQKQQAVQTRGLCGGWTGGADAKPSVYPTHAHWYEAAVLAGDGERPAYPHLLGRLPRVLGADDPRCRRRAVVGAGCVRRGAGARAPPRHHALSRIPRPPLLPSLRAPRRLRLRRGPRHRGPRHRHLPVPPQLPRPRSRPGPAPPSRPPPARASSSARASSPRGTRPRPAA